MAAGMQTMKAVLLFAAMGAAKREDRQKALASEAAPWHEKMAGRFQHLRPKDLEEATTTYTDPDDPEAERFFKWRNLVNRFETRCTEHEVLEVLEANNWNPGPAAAAMLGFRACQAYTWRTPCWPNERQSKTPIDWKLGDSLSTEDQKKWQADKRSRVNWCCERSLPVANRRCSDYTCQQGNTPNQAYFRTPLDGCRKGTTSETGFMNLDNLDVFVQDCPPMNACPEEEVKLHPFMLIMKPAPVRVTDSFPWTGEIHSLTYKLLPLRKLKAHEDMQNRGHRTQQGQLACSFAILTTHGEPVDLGVLPSGSAFKKPISVHLGEKLCWWGCDIAPSADAEFKQNPVIPRDKKKKAHPMAPYSLHVEYSLDNRPIVEAAYGWDVSDETPHVALHWLTYSRKTLITVYQVKEASLTIEDRFLHSDNADMEPETRKVMLTQTDAIYIIHVKDSVHNTRGVIYVQTGSQGCRDDEKCCEQKSGQTQCIKKARKTCSAKGPGWQGARDKAGARSDETCRSCDEEKAPSLFASAHAKLKDKPPEEAKAKLMWLSSWVVETRQRNTSFCEATVFFDVDGSDDMSAWAW